MNDTVHIYEVTYDHFGWESTVRVLATNLPSVLVEVAAHLDEKSGVVGDHRLYPITQVQRLSPSTILITDAAADVFNLTSMKGVQ